MCGVASNCLQAGAPSYPRAPSCPRLPYTFVLIGGDRQMTEIFVSGTEVFSDAKMTDMYALESYKCNLCHTLMVIWENEYFLTSNLPYPFTRLKLCPPVILLPLVLKNIRINIFITIQYLEHLYLTPSH